MAPTYFATAPSWNEAAFRDGKSMKIKSCDRRMNNCAQGKPTQKPNQTFQSFDTLE